MDCPGSTLRADRTPQPWLALSLLVVFVCREGRGSSWNEEVRESGIAFVKTHKTGSTTTAGILIRYAGRHGVKLAHSGKGTQVNLKKYADEVEAGYRDRVDIMHYHISSQGRLRASWSSTHQNYLGIMRDPENAIFITGIREPRSHFISFYYYYVQPVNKLSLEEFLTTQPGDYHEQTSMRNTLSAEFGVTTMAQMEDFIALQLSDFNLILLTDRFDEGLMVLRRMLGWDMIDMTYMTLNETKSGARRGDGKQLVDVPSFESLPEKVQETIDALTMLDKLLYTAAQEEYAKRLQPVSDFIEADLAEFLDLQNDVSNCLNGNYTSDANALYRPKKLFREPSRKIPF